MDLLGETVLFTGAAGMLYYEVHRSNKSSTNRNNQGEMVRIEKQCTELDKRVTKLEKKANA